MIIRLFCFLFRHRSPLRVFNKSIKVLFKKDNIYYRCNYCRKNINSISWNDYKKQNPSSISKEVWSGYLDRIYKNIK